MPESLQDFDKLWDYIQFAYPLIHTPIGDANSFMEIVKKEIDSMDDESTLLLQYHGTARKLIKVCSVLQRMAGDQPFFLSCRVAAHLCGVTHMQTARLLKVLTHDGVLEVVEKGHRHNATTYRYLGPRD